MLVGFGIWRRRSLSNGAVLLAVFGGLALAIVSGTELLDSLLEAFAFERGNGGRILGLAVIAIAILFLLGAALADRVGVNRRSSRPCSRGSPGRSSEARDCRRCSGRIAVVIPAYNEVDNVSDGPRQVPAEVCGIETSILVVDDGSRDGTGDVAAGTGR